MKKDDKENLLDTKAVSKCDKKRLEKDTFDEREDEIDYDQDDEMEFSFEYS